MLITHLIRINIRKGYINQHYVLNFYFLGKKSEVFKKAKKIARTTKTLKPQSFNLPS